MQLFLFLTRMRTWRHFQRNQTWIHPTRGRIERYRIFPLCVQTTPTSGRQTYAILLDVVWVDAIVTVQSAYRVHYSTETAVLRVMADILQALDRGDFAALAFLDLSAAFDTVDHMTLLRRCTAG